MLFIDTGYFVVTPKGVREVHTVKLQAYNIVSIHYVGGGIQSYKVSAKGFTLLDYSLSAGFKPERDKFWRNSYDVLKVFHSADAVAASEYFQSLNTTK